MTTEKEEISGTIDKASFETLFRKYFRGLMHFALKFLQDEDDAREIVQKVFVSLWERRQSLDTSSSLKSYLFTSVRNRSLNMLRDRKKYSEEVFPETPDTTDVHSQLEVLELEEHIAGVIRSLPEGCRRIFEMNRFENKKYGEIADQLGISVKTVENQMSKALKILREKLARYLTLIMWLILYGLN